MLAVEDFRKVAFFPTIMDVENHHFGLEDDGYLNVCRHSLKNRYWFHGVSNDAQNMLHILDVFTVSVVQMSWKQNLNMLAF